MLPDSVQRALMPPTAIEMQEAGEAGSEAETDPGDCAGAAGAASAEATSQVRDTSVQNNSGLSTQDQTDMAHPCTPTQSETADPKWFKAVWAQAAKEYAQAETVPAGAESLAEVLTTPSPLPRPEADEHAEPDASAPKRRRKDAAAPKPAAKKGAAKAKAKAKAKAAGRGGRK